MTDKKRSGRRLPTARGSGVKGKPPAPDSYFVITILRVSAKPGAWIL